MACKRPRGVGLIVFPSSISLSVCVFSVSRTAPISVFACFFCLSDGYTLSSIFKLSVFCFLGETPNYAPDTLHNV